MQEFTFPTTAGELARRLGGKLVGDENAHVEKLSPLSAADRGSLSFLSSAKHADGLGNVRDAVVFTREGLERTDLPVTFILVSDPQLAFAKVAGQFKARSPWQGISPQAAIHPEASLAENVTVGPFAVVSRGARVGRGSVVFAHAYVGAEASVGENCEIHPFAMIGDRVVLGDRVKIFSATVLGSDGFGFFSADGLHREMPQVGTVIIEDDVRIGAHCTVDRGTIGETRVGKGSKLDDHVHVGHNCRIGKNVILCGQVGLSGSVVLEDDVIMGGQVGVAHAVTIGKGAKLGGQTGVGTNLAAGESYAGSPAITLKEHHRILRYFRRLPALWDRVKRLEEEKGTK